jgi:hypothetical protein
VCCSEDEEGRGTTLCSTSSGHDGSFYLLREVIKVVVDVQSPGHEREVL